MPEKLIRLHEYAKLKGLSKQAVYASKTLPIVELDLFVMHKGERIPVGKQKFILFSLFT